MSKVYILRAYDAITQEGWIDGVYATKELAYKEAMEKGNKYYVQTGLHFIEKESTSHYILFGTVDENNIPIEYVEYCIDEWEVKEE